MESLQEVAELVVGEQSSSTRVPAAGNKRPAPRGTAAYPRKRAVTACQVCRARRTKCDNKKPKCSFCEKAGAECIQSAVDLSSFDPASLKILERLDDIEQAIRHTYSPRHDATDGQLSSPPFPPPPPPPPQQQQQSLVPTIGEDIRKIIPMVEDIFTWEPFASILRSIRAKHPPVPAPTYEDVPKSRSEFVDLDLSYEATVQLLDSFFEHVHVKNPILDEARMRPLLTRCCFEGFDNSSQACLALLVCALGAISAPLAPDRIIGADSPEYDRALSFFQGSQKRLGTLMVHGGARAAQCLFLSGVFLITIFKPRAAWRYFLQALACCQDFMLVEDKEMSDTAFVDPAMRPIMSADEQSIYWTAWKSEWEVRFLLKPADFPVDERQCYPPFFPSPPRPAIDMNNEVNILRRQNKAWYFYLSEISLRRLTTRIIVEITSVAPTPAQTSLEAMAAQVPEWENQVQQWLNSLPTEMSLTRPELQSDICIFILRGHLNHAYEFMYASFVAAAIEGRITRDSHPNLWQYVEKGLLHHEQRFLINEPGYRHRHHGTLGLISACSKSACILAKAATVHHPGTNTNIVESLPLRRPDWRGYIVGVRDLCDFWQVEVPRLREWVEVFRALV